MTTPGKFPLCLAISGAVLLYLAADLFLFRGPLRRLIDSHGADETEIVARVEQLFAYADQIEQRVKDAQTRVNHLTQALLAKAFRGELTADWRAQNPDLISGDNSAAALLATIKAERELTQAVKKAKK